MCGAFGPDRDVSSEDETRRRGGLDYLSGCIEFAAAVGSPWVSGPMYATTGQARMLEPDQRQAQWDRAVGQACSKLARSLAGLRRPRPLNRSTGSRPTWSTPWSRACGCADDIDAQNVGLMLDTFHMNIEETTPPGRDPVRGQPRLPLPGVRERPRHAGRRPHRLGRRRPGAPRHRLLRQRGGGVVPPHRQGNRPGGVAVASGGGLDGRSCRGRRDVLAAPPPRRHISRRERVVPFAARLRSDCKRSGHDSTDHAVHRAVGRPPVR